MYTKPDLIMKKVILAVVVTFLFSTAFGQTPAGSFECTATASQTAAQLSSLLSHVSLEDYRLQHDRTTLTFDNGFTVTMYSADEAQHMGLIQSTASYPVAFSPRFKMPVFHLTPSGHIAAGYITRRK
jgi:hypothetical protein